MKRRTVLLWVSGLALVLASCQTKGDATVAPSPGLISVAINVQPAGPTLSWNSVPGLTYQILASASLTAPNWTNISDAIIATDYTTWWTDSEGMSNSQCFYEVVSP
jgi:hypothetical protein